MYAYDAKGKRFDSRSERNKFYRGLFGYKQTVRRNNKVYRYEKPGLLGTIPHIKVEDSVFIVHRGRRQPFTQYFSSWAGKVDVKTFNMILEDNDDALQGEEHA